MAYTYVSISSDVLHSPQLRRSRSIDCRVGRKFGTDSPNIDAFKLSRRKAYSYRSIGMNSRNRIGSTQGRFQFVRMTKIILLENEIVDCEIMADAGSIGLEETFVNKRLTVFQ